MSDPAPNMFLPAGPGGPNKPGAYVVPLARARFILKGQFHHPLKDSDEPLPPHQFYLFCVSKKTAPAVMGEASQNDGVSWINYTLDATEEVPGTTWALAWRPVFKKPDGTFAPMDDVGRGEAWLDLDKMEWVNFKDVAFVDKRKLLRIPLWASFMKIKQGGFKESPKKTKFGTTGVLKYDDNELNAYGDPKKPWVVQVDQGLFHQWVRMVYYDPKEKKTKPVPPGLVVQGIGTRALSGPATGSDSRIAAGTALDDDGTVYLLHERTKANLTKSGYGYFFFTGKSGTAQHGIIDFSKPAAKDKVASILNDPSAKRVERYILPREWHSRGFEAWTTEDGKGVPQRKPFAQMRTADTTKDKPLKFHLDDAVLAKVQTASFAIAKDARITLMDHLLHIRDPDPKRPHMWKTKLPKNYLRAEESVFVAGEGMDRVTRIVFHEGIVYELREKRIQAADGTSFGKVDCIGARAALTNDFDDKHRSANFLGGNPSRASFLNQPKGRTVQHLIDVSDDVVHTVDGKNVKLLHLLVWVPIFFDNKIGAAGEKAIPLLEQAANRIDQKHPAHPTEPPADRVPCEFVLAVDGAVAADAKVVRVRHYFAEVPKTFGDAMKILYTSSADPLARAGANCATHTVTMYRGDIGPGYAPETESGQNTMTGRFTLAHEMGHVVGLPDEYTEVHGTLGDQYNTWDQYLVDNSEARPFFTDGPSLMKSNNKPRLRHYWYYANDLALIADFKKMVDAKTYMPVNLSPVTGGKLVFERPFSPTPPPEVGPYQAVFPGIFLTTGRTHCDCALYRLGTDEGTVETQWKKTAGDVGHKMPDAKLYDAVALIRIKFMIQLAPDLNNAVDRTTIATALRRLMLDGDIFKKQFVMEMDPPGASAGRSKDKPHLRRIFLCFAPEWDLANDYTGAHPPKPVPGNAHVFLDFVKVRATPHPLLSATPPAQLQITPAEIDESILRYAVGVPTFKQVTPPAPPPPAPPPAPVKTLLTTLTAADMKFFADAMHGYLGDTGGGRKVSNT